MTEPRGAGGSVFVSNGGVRLHALDNGRRGAAAPPVVVVPGMGESAAEYGWLLDRLGEQRVHEHRSTGRRVVVVDLRGRGGSDAPASGYTWEDHVGDLGTVISALEVERPVLVAFSRGSSYALGHALAHPERVRGLVVGDYGARHVRPPDAVVERQLRAEIRGVPMIDRMADHAARAIFAESRDVPLWDRLSGLNFPVLVIRGGRRSTVVTDQVADQWRRALPAVEIETIPGAGHDLWSGDPDAYLAALVPFLDRLTDVGRDGAVSA
ncbi:alpha/beta fold hydrolase [Parafrankia discariae]|uniref:alpha/beta fold hydrolase n=1 Tax=Parafrankia discariae TaxID=365528 RepID=UPI001E417C25|nr:alpha/beta hydrolase [Parafrankia discariae]